MNANDMYFEDFRFGDKKLSDFGGIIYNEDGWQIDNGLTSSRITTKLGSRDGELYIGSTYNPRTITIPIFLQEQLFEERNMTEAHKKNLSFYFPPVILVKISVCIYSSVFPKNVTSLPK